MDDQGMSLIPIPVRLRFDVEKLRSYLQASLPAFDCQRGALTVRQFK